jgi:hypothetical protein
LSGRIIEESEEQVVLLDADGAVFDIDPVEISGRAVGLSAMPTGHAENLSRRAMRDLLAYLKDL